MASVVGVASLVALGITVGTTVGPLVVAQPASAAQSPSSCNSTVALANGGFESPVIPANTYQFIQDSAVPGWSTTATDHNIEIWHTPFNGVTADSGDQFAELNATQASTLYQDVPTTPGQTIRWQLSHRGRAGTDVMAVLLGSPTGTLVSQGNISDGLAWGVHSGFYTVPAGQTMTRFGFSSVSTATGNASVGNFLDSISFGTSACVVLTKSVTDLSGGTTAHVGDVLKYSVSADNQGGNPARLAAIVDQLPSGVSYVPGSLTSSADGAPTAQTDASGDDLAEYVSGTKTVQARLGNGASATAGGVIPSGESRSMSFSAVVTAAAATASISNTAGITFVDPLTGNTQSSTSNTTTTPVTADADLGVTQSLTSGPLVAGTPASYTISVTNNGPQADTNALLTSSLPPGLTGVTATGTGATCTIAASQLSCALGTLANGATRTITVQGTVPSAATPGTVYTLSSAVSGDVHDAVSSNNTATTSASTTESADLALTMTTSPATPAAGTNVTYSIVTTNNGPSTARNLTITDPLSSGDTFVSATVDGGTCSLSSGSVVCTVASLASGATANTHIVVTLAPGAGAGVVQNQANVSASTPDPNLSNNNDEVSVNTTADADLGVVISLNGHTTAYAGDQVPYTLTLTNHGPSTATNVSLSTALPAGFTIISRNGGGFCTPSACNYPTLAPGEVQTVTGFGMVSADAPAGPAQATTTVISPTPDSVSSNDSSTVGLTVLLKSDLAITSDFPTTIVPGTTTTGTFTITNNGPTRSEGVVMQATIPAGVTAPVVTVSEGTCSVAGTTLTCTLDSLANAADWVIHISSAAPASLSGSTVGASASVTADTPDPDTSNNSISQNFTITPQSDLKVVKTTSTPNVVQTGTIRFTITITNNGPSDASGVVVAEQPQPGVLVSSATPSTGLYDDPSGNWQIATLANGATATLSVVGTAQGSGTLTNSASVTDQQGTDPDSSNNTDSATVSVTPAAKSLSITTTPTVTPAADQGGVRTGDTIAYSYLVTNTGNVTMTNVSVTDQLVGAVTCPQVTLAAGDSETCTSDSTHRVTQSDYDAGVAITNSASVVGTPPAGPALTFGPASSSIPTARSAPALSATKIANFSDTNSNGALNAGETIDWTIRVTNTGDISLFNLAVDDPIAGTITCPVTTLAPGDSASCTAATYTITAADAAVGQITNSATASATSPRRGRDIESNTATVTTPSVLTPAVSIVTSGVVTPAADQTGAALGDGVTWAYEVTNLGNVPLTNLTINDPEGGSITCDVATIEPGDSAECAGDAVHTISQADIVAGHISNSATVTAAPTVGGGSITSDPSTATVATEAVQSSLSLATTITNASNSTPGAPVYTGNELTSSYALFNTGNVTLTGVGVTDPAFGPITCAATTLLPGESTTCTSDAPHTVSPSDLAAGSVTSSAAATGTPPAGTGATPAMAFDTTVVAVSSKSLTITTTPSVTPSADGAGVHAGDTISYSYVVVNTGSVTMSNVTVSDALVGTVICPTSTLAPQQSEICTATSTYRVTQADFDSGDDIVNSAPVSGTPPTSSTAISFGPATSTVPVAAASPALSAQKIANFSDTNNDGALTAGETIDWSIRLSNTGDVTLGDLTVDDPIGGTITCPVTFLAPNASTTCTAATYTITAADVAAGQIVNTATASAASPRGGARIASNSTSTTTPSVAAPALTIVTSGAVSPTADQGGAKLGDSITWHYEVTNTGNIILDSIAVVDPEGGTITCGVTTLEPGQSTECVGSDLHTVTEADLLAGSISNGATAEGTAPGAPAATDSNVSTARVLAGPIVAQIAIVTTITNTSNSTAGAPAKAGDALQATYVVTNTGNVTLHGVTVTDPTFGPVTCASTTLAPGASTTCTATSPYTVTTGDVAAGAITSTAIATGTPPTGSGPANATDVDTKVIAVASAPVKPVDSTNPLTVLGFTGTDPTGPLLVGVILLLAGGLTVLLVRRRRLR